MQTIPDPSNEIPVIASVDLLVVGGGMTGVTAAIAGGRMGLKTLIVEQFNCLGGTATSGGHNHISQFHAWDSDTRVVGGITYEIAERIVDGGYGTWDRVGCVDFHLEGMKLVLDQMIAEVGVNVLYYTFFCKALVDANGHVTGVIVQNKSGRAAIMARRIIDCTGDGDVAASAGAPFQQGREPDGLSQPTTLMFTIGGVDWPTADAWRTDYKMTEVWEQAQADGIMEPFQNVIMGWWHTDVLPDQVGVNMTHMTHIDSTDANDLTKATIEGRRQAHHLLDVFKQVVTGMADAYMISTAPALGLRESRRIVGPVVLHEDDILSSREWEDAICYGSFYVDIHNLDGPGMSETTVYPPEGFCYQIPYRVMVPQNVENLLVAGRCISTTHVALGSTRVMITCMALGEAAGAAAAISLREETAMIDIPVPELQTQLKQQGVILERTAIEAVN
ncbi:FAD-dependent oxidoreductase [Chloroflexota bacterium]